MSTESSGALQVPCKCPPQDRSRVFFRVVCALFKLFEWPRLEHTNIPMAIALAIVDQPMKLVSRKV